jgi:peptidoglycan DL-endopeptidase CwlO
VTQPRRSRTTLVAAALALAVSAAGVVAGPATAATSSSAVTSSSAAAKAAAASAAAVARLASLRAAAVVPGSSDPIAIAGAAAVQAQLDLLATGFDDGTAASTRRALAELVATRAKLSADDLDAVWANTDGSRLVALFAALGQYGVPYRTYQSKPGIGFDCSGLTTFAWSVAGVNLPRTSGSQIVAIPATTLAAAKPADILWYPGHVGLSLGLGKVYLHAPYPGRTVEIVAIHRVSRVGSPVI